MLLIIAHIAVDVIKAEQEWPLGESLHRWSNLDLFSSGKEGAARQTVNFLLPFHKEPKLRVWACWLAAQALPALHSV